MRWGITLDYPGEPNAIARVLMRGRAERQSQRRGRDNRSRGQREKMPHAALEVDAWATSQGCRHLQKQQKARRHSLLEPPPVQELTASLSLNLEGNKVNGQLRMRRGRSIQISASMLGLVEVARVEFLPDMVVVMDRFHNVYSVFHYADIPYRNELGLDFDVVQALF